jgi:hypothetical protein
MSFQFVVWPCMEDSDSHSTEQELGKGNAIAVYPPAKKRMEEANWPTSGSRAREGKANVHFPIWRHPSAGGGGKCPPSLIEY